MVPNDIPERQCRSQTAGKASGMAAEAPEQDRPIGDLVRQGAQLVEDRDEMPLGVGGPADELNELSLGATDGETRDDVEHARTRPPHPGIRLSQPRVTEFADRHAPLCRQRRPIQRPVATSCREPPQTGGRRNSASIECP